MPERKHSLCSSLGVLRRLASALQAVLLPFLLARIARQEAGLLQYGAQLRVVLEQGARDAVGDRPGLARLAAADDFDTGVEALGVDDPEGCHDDQLESPPAEIFE